MYRWIVRKRQRDTRRLAEQHDKDVKAWLLIGAIFVGTILAVWLPLLFSAMGHG